jgi:hypothetical protein
MSYLVVFGEEIRLLGLEFRGEIKRSINYQVNPWPFYLAMKG